MKQTAMLTLISILLLVMLAACNGSARMTPTPFPPTWTPGPALAAQQSFQVEIADLLAEPETYEGVYVQVTGRYQKRPLLVCESESATNNAPATWELHDNTNLFLAAGEFDQALRSLVPNGLTMTVAGYWQLWEGQVGCGKQAAKQQMWFLEVTDIVSPSPVVQVTLTPSLEGQQPIFSEDVVTPGSGQEPGDPTGGALQPVATETEFADTSLTPEFSPPPTGTAPSDVVPTSADTNPTSPAGTPGGNQVATPTSSSPLSPPTVTRPGGSATPTPRQTATVGSGGTAATATKAPIDQNTPVAGNQNIVQKEDLIEEDIGIDFLAANEIHEWNLDLVDSTVVTISLAAEPDVNLGFEIHNQSGSVIAQSKQAPANQIETVKMLTVNPNENYKIRVLNEAASGEGGYALSIWGNLEDSFMLDARGMLAEGQVGSATIPDGYNAVHLWFFYGEDGDVVSFTTSTDSTHLITLSFLFDPEGNDILDFSEQDIELTSTGLYTVGLWEDGGEQADYTISFSKE